MTRSPNRLLATAFGAIYLLVGITGFAITGFSDFTGTHGHTLIVFDINPLHNVIHLAIGGILLAASRTVAAAKAANTTVGAGYLLVGVVGLFLTGTEANIIALNGADNVLHLASAVLLLVIGLAADRTTSERIGTSV